MPSFNIRIANDDLVFSAGHFITFDGGWIREAHKHERALEYGRFVNESTTGNSSNRHNPGFLIAEAHASEQAGRVYGFPFGGFEVRFTVADGVLTVLSAEKV